jgi:hypothetical protein
LLGRHPEQPTLRAVSLLANRLAVPIAAASGHEGQGSQRRRVREGSAD